MYDPVLDSKVQDWSNQFNGVIPVTREVSPNNVMSPLNVNLLLKIETMPYNGGRVIGNNNN